MFGLAGDTKARTDPPRLAREPIWSRLTRPAQARNIQVDEDGKRIALGTNEKAADEILSRLKLDIRALTLLQESDAELRPVLERSLLQSQDAYVVRFLSLLQSKRPPEREGNLPVALAEIVLASFLTLIGLAAVVPVMAGLTTPQQWVSYFSSVVAPSTEGPLYFGVPLLDFVFSALLLLGAFYSLRRASKTLKNAGLILEPGRN
jgi:hypothetical protein